MHATLTIATVLLASGNIGTGSTAGQLLSNLAHQLIAPGHVRAGEHFLPIDVLLLQVLPVALLYAAQAADISFCGTFLLNTTQSDAHACPDTLSEAGSA